MISLAEEGLVGILGLLELLVQLVDELTEDEGVDVLAQLVDKEPEKTENAWSYLEVVYSKDV